MSTRHGSIRRKVLSVIATAAFAAVVLAGLALALYDVIAFRRGLVKEQETLARMVAFHSAASLVFDDPDYARSILGGLAVHEDVEEAVLERADGSEFASYTRLQREEATEMPRLSSGHRFEGAHLFLAEPVIRESERLGTLRVSVSLDDIHARRRSQLLVMTGVLVAAYLLVLALSSRLSSVIVNPVLGLAQAAERIGERDLSTRVDARYDDELGILATAFNEMAERLSATTVSKDYLDDVLESMNDALIIADADGRIERVNQAGLELLGHEERELVGKPAETLFGERDDLLDEARSGGHVEDRECFLRTRDGESIPSSLSIALLGEEGDPRRATVVVARDIRERKQAEESLQQSEMRFRCLVEQAADGFFVFDGDGRISGVNQRACQALGYERDELLEKNVKDFVVGFDLEQRRSAWERLKPGQAATHERLLRRRDGSDFPVEVRMSVVRLGDERSYFALARDITERKEQERALIDAREAALETSRLKSQFLANMSHEIRTPMNGIIGLTEIALDTELSSEQRGYLEMVRSSAGSLLRLIDDLLDLSGIEGGGLTLDAVAFTPSECVFEAMNSLAFEAHRKGLEVVADIAPEVPPLVVGDQGRLQQVLMNLISNAIKFTERGGVVVRVRAAGAGPSRARMLFAVEDSGIGIPVEKREAIFGTFAQADGSTTRRFGGAGLGLAIASRLVAAMGGTLRLESDPGRGSTFHFELSLPLPARQTERPDEMPIDLLGLTALVVDDNESSREVLERLLTRWGAVAQCAATVSEAEALAASSSPFDLVIVDDHLAGEPGADLALRFGAAGTRAVLVLTTPGAGRRLTGGGLETLAKPVEPLALLSTLRRLVSPDTQSKSERSSGERTTRVRPMKVLVAEDNAVNCAVVEKALRKRGHAVVAVPTGRHAVERIAAESFDLVLMDIQMPEMDGIEATRVIREAESASGKRRIPIVALTAHAMKGDRDRCLSAGMDDYVSKPVKPATLLEAVEQFAPTREAADAAAARDSVSYAEAPARAAGRGEARGATAASVASEPDLDLILDLEALMERLGDEEDLLEEVVRLYFEEAPDLVARLGRGLQQDDREDARRAAHRLRGMLSTMGANRSSSIAARLEAALVEGNRQSAASENESFVESLRELDEELRRLDATRRAPRARVTR